MNIIVSLPKCQKCRTRMLISGIWVDELSGIMSVGYECYCGNRYSSTSEIITYELVTDDNLPTEDGQS